MTAPATAIEVLHGVNLDMLGKRDPEHYGTLTLVEWRCASGTGRATLGLEASFFHTNSEADSSSACTRRRRRDGLILNPGAWTHYS